MGAAEVAVCVVQGHGTGVVLGLFLGKALVRRVKRRIPMRIFRFCLSKCDTPICAMSGLPKIASLIAPVDILSR